MFASLLSSQFGLNGFETNILSSVGGVTSVGLLVILLGILFFVPNVWTWNLRPTMPAAISAAFLFVFCILRFDGESPFLYFQF